MWTSHGERKLYIPNVNINKGHITKVYFIKGGEGGLKDLHGFRLFNKIQLYTNQNKTKQNNGLCRTPIIKTKPMEIFLV